MPTTDELYLTVLLTPLIEHPGRVGKAADEWLARHPSNTEEAEEAMSPQTRTIARRMEAMSPQTRTIARRILQRPGRRVTLRALNDSVNKMINRIESAEFPASTDPTAEWNKLWRAARALGEALRGESRATTSRGRAYAFTLRPSALRVILNASGVPRVSRRAKQELSDLLVHIAETIVSTTDEVNQFEIVQSMSSVVAPERVGLLSWAQALKRPENMATGDEEDRFVDGWGALANIFLFYGTAILRNARKQIGGAEEETDGTGGEEEDTDGTGGAEEETDGSGGAETNATDNESVNIAVFEDKRKMLRSEEIRAAARALGGFVPQTDEDLHRLCVLRKNNGDSIDYTDRVCMNTDKQHGGEDGNGIKWKAKGRRVRVTHKARDECTVLGTTIPERSATSACGAKDTCYVQRRRRRNTGGQYSELSRCLPVPSLRRWTHVEDFMEPPPHLNRPDSTQYTWSGVGLRHNSFLATKKSMTEEESNLGADDDDDDNDDDGL